MSLQLLVVVLILAAYSITRLITTDAITQPPRMWLLGKLKAGGMLSTLATCSWCAGTWVSAALVLAVDRWWRPVPLPWVWVAAVRVGVGMLSDGLGLAEAGFYRSQTRMALEAVETDLMITRNLNETPRTLEVLETEISPNWAAIDLSNREKAEAEARKANADAELAELELNRRRPVTTVVATQPCDKCGKELTRALRFNGHVYCVECAAALGATMPAPIRPATRIRGAAELMGN